MATPAPRAALLCLVFLALLAVPASAAYPGPIPNYNNTVAPTLANGQEPALAKAPPAGTRQTPAATSSRCRKAKRSLRSARKKLRRYQRKLKRARRASRRRALRGKVRRLKKSVRRAKRTVRRRCAVKASAIRRPQVRAAETYARHIAGLVYCGDGGQMSLYAGPDMRSHSRSYVQGVAYKTALFRWVGGRWAYQVQYPYYWWTVASYDSPPFTYYNQNGDEMYVDQGYTINQAGLYRMAVRYHWFTNARGAPTATAWHWAGSHVIGGNTYSYCTYR